MRKTDKWMRMMVLALGISSAAMMTSFAADKTISSVSLRVESELEPGDTLPEISYTNGSSSADVGDGAICIVNTSTKYSIAEVEWITSTSKTMDVGDQPTMKVRLTPETVGNDDYYFKGTYRSSNVSVKNDGTFMSASKDDGDLIVKLKVDPIKGDFPAPEGAYWKDNSKGTARWEEPDDGGTGRYEVVLRRGSTKIKTVEVTGHSYNFYPYMTKKGTYTFRVRTIAKTNKEEDYGKNSDWVESDEIYLAEEDVSDGSGQNDDTTTAVSNPGGNYRVGWMNHDNGWYYYYPDGSCQKDSWLKVNDKWYLFGNDGRMLTGWQNRNGQTYYLTENGDMLTGWIQAGQRWYYLNPTQDDYVGCLLRSTWANVDGKIYYFNSDGAMMEGWNQVDGNWYYFYPGYGHKATNTHIDGFYVNQDGVWVR